MTDWRPEPADIAATREARRDGSLHALLLQEIAAGKARLLAATAKSWPVSGKRCDISGVTCPHCGALPDQRCQLRTRPQQLTKPHPQRITAWAQLVACCPTCQAAPGQSCHRDGKPLPGKAATIHAARYQEAEATTA